MALIGIALMLFALGGIGTKTMLDPYNESRKAIIVAFFWPVTVPLFGFVVLLQYFD